MEDIKTSILSMFYFDDLSENSIQKFGFSIVSLPETDVKNRCNMKQKIIAHLCLSYAWNFVLWKPYFDLLGGKMFQIDAVRWTIVQWRNSENVWEQLLAFPEQLNYCYFSYHGWNITLMRLSVIQWLCTECFLLDESHSNLDQCPHPVRPCRITVPTGFFLSRGPIPSVCIFSSHASPLVRQ